MSSLDKALAEISAIRAQMARATEFRGLGPMTSAATALVAVGAAEVQGVWIAHPAAHLASWLALWTGAAACSAVLVGAEMVTRSHRLHSDMAESMIWAAIEQLVPAGVAGALLTAVLWLYAPEALWMLPGLWQILFGLALFAACRVLPRSLMLAGAAYIGAGVACLALARGASALSPWAMGAPFGLGQALIAVLLQRGLGADDV
ncbi:MAG TPA: hypothetical protein VKT30_11965 [Caulobacteraceae bacterium]|nr:hypothetical protein [Caulobacteraceae bacterium]